MVIAADTSAWIDFVKGIHSAYAVHLENVLASGTLIMPEGVLYEVLSWPKLPPSVAQEFLRIPRLEQLPGFWERTAKTRSSLLRKGLKAAAMDCLIAQGCIDHKVSLICRDVDFRHFKKFGLEIID